MTKDEIEQLERLISQIDGMHREISALAKKSDTNAVNAFKLKLINAVLKQANAILGEKHRPFPDFDQFSDEAMPSNSDVTFILTQYAEATELYRTENIFDTDYHGWSYVVTNAKGQKLSMQIATSPPKALGRK